MPSESPLYQNRAPFHDDVGPSGKLATNCCLQQYNRFLVLVENILEAFELMMEDDLCQELSVFYQP